jgi:hypothetical protein
MRRNIVDHGLDVVAIGNVELPGFRGPTARSNLGGDRLRALGRIVSDRDLGALRRKHPRRGAAHPAGRAGDENGQSGHGAAELFEIGHAFLL